MFFKDQTNGLVYVDSLNIKAFPCGRRKAALEEVSGEKLYIPFDPEARLNTEANNRKHSGLNGFAKSYLLDWERSSTSITLVLAGYRFDIKFSDYEEGSNVTRIIDADSFGTALYKLLVPEQDRGGDRDTKKIYANILTADMQFFSIDGTDSPNSLVNTEILRDQAFSMAPETCLDLGKIQPAKAVTDYYFSGLTFSTRKLETIKPELETSKVMHPESLLLMEYVDNAWHICEKSRLPKIEHGPYEDSVYIPGDLIVDGEITTEAIKVKDGKDEHGNDKYLYATTLEVVTDNEVTNQLQFWTRPKTKTNNLLI